MSPFPVALRPTNEEHSGSYEQGCGSESVRVRSILRSSIRSRITMKSGILSLGIEFLSDWVPIRNPANWYKDSSTEYGSASNSETCILTHRRRPNTKSLNNKKVKKFSLHFPRLVGTVPPWLMSAFYRRKYLISKLAYKYGERKNLPFSPSRRKVMKISKIKSFTKMTTTCTVRVPWITYLGKGSGLVMPLLWASVSVKQLSLYKVSFGKFD